MRIFVRDLDSRVVYWNSGAEKLYGWKKHEARGQVTHELLHTQFPEPVSDITAQVLKTGNWAGELRLPAPRRHHRHRLQPLGAPHGRQQQARGRP